MSEQTTNGIDLSGLGNFDFTPAWAKSTEKVSVSGHRGDEGKGRYGDGATQRDRERGPRKPFGEKKPFGDRLPRKSTEGHKPFVKAERPRPLDCEIKVLPETKALGTIMRKIQGGSQAYKLKELAYFLLDTPASILLKITPKAPEGGEALKFHQCKACGFAATRAEEVAEHVLNTHLGDYYDAKEIDCEPPKGNFTCVAKCGLTGVLLGPPNIHEFNSTVREMLRVKFPHMTEADYRSRIEMVRDSESIEAWRASAVKKTVYFAKGQAEVEGASQMTREQAEGEFKRMILPSLIEQPKHLMITAEMVAKSTYKPLVWAVNDAIAAERRQPYAMCFALRGAFHHRKMTFFRANDAHGPEFVAGIELKPFDAEHAIPELAAVARYLEANPCLDKSEFPAEIPDFEKHLMWLVSTGHAISFTKGVFSAVEKFPKYGPQWKKRQRKVASEGELKQATKVEQVSEVAVDTTAEVETKVEEKKEEEHEASAQLA